MMLMKMMMMKKMIMMRVRMKDRVILGNLNTSWKLRVNISSIGWDIEDTGVEVGSTLMMMMKKTMMMMMMMMMMLMMRVKMKNRAFFGNLDLSWKFRGNISIIGRDIGDTGVEEGSTLMMLMKTMKTMMMLTMRVRMKERVFFGNLNASWKFCVNISKSGWDIGNTGVEEGSTLMMMMKMMMMVMMMMMMMLMMRVKMKVNGDEDDQGSWCPCRAGSNDTSISQNGLNMPEKSGWLGHKH